MVRAQKNPLDVTGRTVAANVRRLSEGISNAELVRRLDRLGRHIPVLGLAQVKTGDRRVDADDLTALAAALDVSPATLLMPETREAAETVEITGATQPASGRRAWEWLTAQWPLDAEQATSGRALATFRQRAVPEWDVEQFDMRPVRQALARLRSYVNSALEDHDPEAAYVGVPTGQDRRRLLARALRNEASLLPSLLEQLAAELEDSADREATYGDG